MSSPFDQMPFDQMPNSPFVRLRNLLAQTDYDGDKNDVTDLVLGEPRHAPPAFALDILSAERESYSHYPPIQGLPEFRAACAGWLSRRFSLAPERFPEPCQILPVNGTREALFLIAQLAPRVPREKGGEGGKAKNRIAMPNPFYPVYAAAALAAGAMPLYLNATKATGFLPDLEALTPENLSSLRAFFMCAPANPQGALADLAYLTRLLELAHQYDFWVIMDECYIDIYDREFETAPPISALNAAFDEGAGRAEGLDKLIVFHSLSKRSNVPGLRSGFCVGGADIMAAFLRLRMVAGAQTPIAAQRAASALWADDAHAAASRKLYQEKNDIAEDLLNGHFDFFRPQGGFFLWLNVRRKGGGKESGNRDEAAATALWRHGGIRVLPGGYLAQNTEQNGKKTNPADAYIRVALVEDAQKTKSAITRMRDILLQEGFE